MKVVTAVLFAIALAGRAEPRAQGREYVLDLTGFQTVGGFINLTAAGHVPERERLNEGPVVITSDGPTPPPAASPFTATVTSLTFDQPAYTQGNRLIYEVTAVNGGAVPLRFPTSIDPSLFSWKMHDTAVVNLGLLNPERSSYFPWTFVLLYGAAAVPASLVYLQPGESIRVRVPTEWQWSGTESRRFKVVIRPTYDGRLFPNVLSDFDVRVETLAPR